MTVYAQSGSKTRPDNPEYGDRIVLKNGSFFVVDNNGNVIEYAPKSEVDKKMPKSGGTFTGPVYFKDGKSYIDAVSGALLALRANGGVTVQTPAGAYQQIGAASFIVKGIGGVYDDGGGAVSVRANGGVSIKNMAGEFTIITASFFNTSSSERFKDILGAMEYERARKVLDAELIQFKYKKDFCDDDDIHYGVKAEQIDEIGLGDVVCYDAEGLPTGVDYSKFVPYLIGVIQEQNRRIEALEAKK